MAGTLCGLRRQVRSEDEPQTLWKTRVCVATCGSGTLPRQRARPRQVEAGGLLVAHQMKILSRLVTLCGIKAAYGGTAFLAASH